MTLAKPYSRDMVPGSLAGAPFFLVVAVFLYATLFTFAQTDDFCTFGRLIWRQDANPFQETWNLYLTWTGRYSSTFVVTLGGWLIAIVPLAEHWLYSAFVAALLLALAVALHAAQHIVGVGGRGRWLPGLILFAFVLVLTPSKLEGLLWMTGAAVYTLGIGALLWQALEMQRDLRVTQAGLGVSWRSLAAIFVVTGFNELLALSAGGMIVLVAIAYRQRRYWPQHLAYLAVFVTALLITTLAPGNFARDSLSAAVRHDVPMALRLAWESLDLFWTTRLSVAGWLVLYLAGASVAAGLWLGRTQGVVAASLRRLWPLWVVLVSALPLHAVVYSFLTGEAMPGRIVNQAYLMGLVGIGLMSTWIGLRLSAGAGRRVPAALVMLALGLVLVTSAPFRSFVLVLKEDAPGWRSEQLARAELLQQARRLKQPRVSLPAFSDRPGLVSVLQGADISADPTYWVNTCLAGYARVPEIVVQAPAAAAE